MGANARRVAEREAAGTAGQGKNAQNYPNPYRGETPEQTAARSAEDARQGAWVKEQARLAGDPVINGQQQIRGNYGFAPDGWQPGGGSGPLVGVSGGTPPPVGSSPGSLTPPGGSGWSALNGGGGSAPPASGGSAPGGGSGSPGSGYPGQNTAQEDPRLAAHAKRIEARLDDPMGSTGRAIDVAGSKIRDAFEGRRSALKGMMAGRGMMSSSSAPEIQAGRLANDEGRAVAGAAADIALARERDNDAFMLGATGALAAPGEAMARDRAFNLNQFLGLEGNRRADESLALDRWNMGESNRRADQSLSLSAWEAQENQRRMQEAAQINNFMSQLSLIDRLSMF